MSDDGLSDVLRKAVVEIARLNAENNRLRAEGERLDRFIPQMEKAADRNAAETARLKERGPLATESMPDREWTDEEWLRNQWHMANEACTALLAELAETKRALEDLECKWDYEFGPTPHADGS